jgi:DNA modification methylase
VYGVTPYWSDPWLTVYQGDCREVMAAMEPASVHCVVTSPPYWGLRDYGSTGQLGLEPTPEAYVENMVAVFREVRRVLRDDGTVWLNLGDSYATTAPGTVVDAANMAGKHSNGDRYRRPDTPRGLKPKDLVGIPWRVAFALQADGWYLRSDIIWSKPNPMPESVTDRPTKSHEYLFLLSKSPRYYFDAKAVAEPAEYSGPNGAQHSPYGQGFTRRSATWEERKAAGASRGGTGFDVAAGRKGAGNQTVVHGEGLSHDLGSGLSRNIRSVWTIATQPYPGAHFATFPPKLVEPCVKAGCPVDRTVLDPFAGSGTTGMVAQRLSRKAVLIDLNADYLVQALGRNQDIPLGLDVA